jgi:hypothetical protein
MVKVCLHAIFQILGVVRQFSVHWGEVNHSQFFASGQSGGKKAAQE